MLAAPLAWLTIALLRIVQWVAHFPGWSYRIPGPPVWLVCLFFLAALLLATALRGTHSWKRKMLVGTGGALALGTLTIAIHPFAPKWAKGKLELTTLDVGQGDSLLIVSPGGRTMLIDGGGAFGGFPGREEQNGIDPGEEAVSPYLWSRGFQKLDIVALTHAHQDHIGGLTAVLENFRVGNLWIGREVSSAALARLETFAREKKITIVHEIRGQKFSLDTAEGEFLWPEIAPEVVGPGPKNNDSLVLRLKYGNLSMMLPGDAEKQAEKKILAENNEDVLRADVLKVGHHGSKNSTTAEFLAAVRPRVAVISAGEENPYGHPSPELLERLQRAGLRILRTDHDGAIHVLTDGERLEITCFVACPEAAVIEALGHPQTPNQ
jgi:competence protein ComEC